tara:strand:- start:181 stop:735 length:555 start_codon:yes stop_codon:yes gene_type:complete
LTKNECASIVQEFEDNIDETFEGLTSGGVQPEYKLTRDWTLDPDGDIFRMFVDRSNTYVDKYLDGYGEEDLWDPYTMFSEGSHYPSWQIQRYTKGEGHYNAWHNEEPYLKKHSNRMFVVMFYLNDVIIGGTTEFLYTRLQITPKAGTFCIWPAGFPYVHKGNMPASNDKYIATTWLCSSHQEEE